MADETARHRGLGRGLSALLGEEPPEVPRPSATVTPASATADSQARPRTLPLAFLKPNRLQPRKVFNEEELKNLADSIRDRGVIQPILVRPLGQDSYEIVAGERRWRAAQLAKLHEVPVTIRQLSDAQALELAIIENVQRTDLSAIEEANAYQELMARFKYTQDKLSDIIGKSRSHIANTLRLLKLPESVQAMIIDGRLSAGHARTLVGSPDPEAQAREIVESAMTVRQAEKKAKAPKSPSPAAAAPKDADTREIERSLSNALGMTVTIEHQGQKGGSLRIAYKTLEQLDDIIRRLNTFVEVD